MSGCAVGAGAGPVAPLLRASFGLWELDVLGPALHGGDLGRREFTHGNPTCAVALIKGILDRVTRVNWGSRLGRMRSWKAF